MIVSSMRLSPVPTSKDLGKQMERGDGQDVGAAKCREQLDLLAIPWLPDEDNHRADQDG